MWAFSNDRDDQSSSRDQRFHVPFGNDALTRHQPQWQICQPRTRGQHLRLILHEGSPLPCVGDLTFCRGALRLSMGFMGRHDETSCRSTIELDAEGGGEAGLSVDTMRVACALYLPGVMRAHRSLLLEHPPAYEGFTTSQATPIGSAAGVVFETLSARGKPPHSHRTRSAGSVTLLSCCTLSTVWICVRSTEGRPLASQLDLVIL